MKKTVLSLAMLLAGAQFTFAQFTTPTDHSIEFVTKDGTVVEDGSVLNLTEVEEDPSGDNFGMINSGLYIKNMTNGIVLCKVTNTAEYIPSGAIQFCFGGFCSTYPDNGSPIPGQTVTYPVENYVFVRDVMPIKTEAEAPYLGVADKDLQNEWFLEEGKYGTARESIQIEIYVADASENVTFKAKGPKITVNFVYADPAGISGNTADKKLSSLTYYDLSGRKVSNPTNGVYVKKFVYADGTVNTEKVTVK